MATYQTLRGPALNAHLRAQQKALSIAEPLLGGRSALTVRSLRPEDLNSSLNSWNFSVTATSSSSNLINNQSISNNRWPWINGISYPDSTPLIDQVTITGKGETLRVWNIEDIPNFQDNVGYFDDPVLLHPNTNVTVAGYNGTTSTSTAVNLILLGGVVEQKGQVTAN